jgi:putative pyruvate formate lyase activating enzyme
MGDAVRVARAALHPFEEPPISGVRGSGTVFFAGCSLGCIFCQNKSIRGSEEGVALTHEQLCRLLLAVQDAGAHNINLVTPTHFADHIAAALQEVKPLLHVPVVYNCGGYERVETLALLEGLVDVYLPDFKYSSHDLACAYSAAPDYAEHAANALAEMYRQTGDVRFDEDGMLISGIMVRHLVLPGSRKDSMAVLDRVAKTVPVHGVRLSLMRQYTPVFAPVDAPACLHRTVTSFEYESVMAHAVELGFEGFFQGKESASDTYTPDFEKGEILQTIFE